MVYHIMPTMSQLFTCVVYVPLPPPMHLKSGCPWLSSEYLLLDLYHGRLSHNMNRGHGLPLADRMTTKANMWKGFLFQFEFLCAK